MEEKEWGPVCLLFPKNSSLQLGYSESLIIALGTWIWSFLLSSIFHDGEDLCPLIFFQKLSVQGTI